MTYGEVVLMANTELLHRVLKHLKDNPHEYDRQRWHKDVAGWALRLSVPGVEVKRDSCDIETMFDGEGNRIWISDIGPWAQRLLDLTRREAELLFSGMNTLEDVERIIRQITAGVRA